MDGGFIETALPISEVLASAFYGFGPVAGALRLPPLSKSKPRFSFQTLEFL